MNQNIKDFIIFFAKNKLLYLGLFIYLLFNLSTLYSIHFMDYFFFSSSIHYCCQGLDFYQIPNGYYAFINGGTLDGNIPNNIIQYSKNHVTNFNVYHPLTTINLGFFFTLFSPDLSIKLWMIIKIIITAITLFYIFINFKGSKFLSFAIFIFLVNFSQYNDIRISQYQFLFNILTVYFLINLIKNKNSTYIGIFYFSSLLIKPVGLLFAPILLIRMKIKVLSVGLILFIVSTLTFKLLGIGDYYINNLIFHISNPIPAKGIDFLSLDALLRNGFGISENYMKIIKYTTLIIIYSLAFSKRISILKIIFLLIIFFLFFYDLIFQYHFSILGPILALCIIHLKEFQSLASRFLILVISLPTTFFLFRLFEIGIVNDPLLGIDPTLTTWKVVSIFQLLPIFLLAIIVLIPDFKYYLKLIKK